MTDTAVATKAPLIATRVYGEPNPRNLALIHGWGASSEVWRDVVPELARHFCVTTVDLPGFGESIDVDHGYEIEPLVEDIHSVLPDNTTLLGWSLGGAIAARLLDTYPDHYVALISIASNPCFVARGNWPAAMPASTFAGFSDGFANQPGETLKRFAALQAQGDKCAGAVRRGLRRFDESQVDTGIAARALALLQSLDVRESLARTGKPVLHLLAERDSLVPAILAEDLPELNRDHSVRLLPGTGHAPMLSAPELLIAVVLEFTDSIVGDCTSQIEKKQLSDSFSRAAETYDGVAGLQRTVGEELMDRLPTVNREGAVVDLGCGTGCFTRQLANRFPSAKTIGMDLAPGMLAYAGKRFPNEPIEWACGDAEQLSLEADSTDLVYSNFTLQWCSRLNRVFSEAWRVLKPGCRFVFSTLGPDTLWELRAAWRVVDDSVHANHFIPGAAVRSQAELAGFKLVEFSSEMHTRRYAELSELTHELKALGAHNINQGRQSGLTGRNKLRKFRQAYEHFRTKAGELPATYQVYYVVLEKPHDA
jgi:malonyl-CoA O-methyltransferase